MDTWTLLKRHYKTFLLLPQDARVLDYIATHDILIACAKGKSNETIARELDEPVRYVNEVIFEMFSSSGYNNDLDFDCKRLYDRYKYNQYLYLYFAREYDRISSISDLKKSFRINVVFDNIEKEIQRYDETA